MFAAKTDLMHPTDTVLVTGKGIIENHQALVLMMNS